MKNNEFLLLYKKYTPLRKAIKNTIQSANANGGNIALRNNYRFCANDKRNFRSCAI